VSAALDLFAYERPGDRTLVLAAGVPTNWLAGPGVAVENLRTPGGKLSYGLRRDEHGVMLTIDGGLTLPAGGLVYGWPYGGSPAPARTNEGHRVPWKNRELRILAVPATVVIAAPASDSE
jgi:hypothetical protein